MTYDPNVLKATDADRHNAFEWLREQAINGPNWRMAAIALEEWARLKSPSPEETAYTRWLEDELAEVVRLAHRGLFDKMGGDDEITDTLRLHGIRLMIGADEERYEKLLERIKSREPQSDAQEKS